MTKRLDAAGAGYARDPYNWYREPAYSVEQLFDAIDFGDDLIFDPCCGAGGILDVAAKRGHPTVGADIIDRHKPGAHRFYRANFLQTKTWPAPPLGRALSIVCNPPYGKQDGYNSISADIIFRTLNMIPFHRAAFLVPIDLCSVGRYRFYQRFKPSHVAYCSERPSMPPGDLVAALGDKAYKNGMSDYVWICWSSGGAQAHRWRTESVWLTPTGY